MIEYCSYCKRHSIHSCYSLWLFIDCSFGYYLELDKMKAMILVWGASERGKSQSIKRLAMTMPFFNLISS